MHGDNQAVILISSSDDDDEKRCYEKNPKRSYGGPESLQNHGGNSSKIILVNLGALRAALEEAEASKARTNSDFGAPDLANVENVKGKEKEELGTAVLAEEKQSVEAITISDDDDATENTNEEAQHGTFEANETTEASRLSSGIVLSSVCDLFFSSPDKNCATEDITAGGGIASSAVNDLFLTSLREDAVISNTEQDSRIESSAAVDIPSTSSEKCRGFIDIKCCRSSEKLEQVDPLPSVNKKKKRRRRRRKKELFQGQVRMMHLGQQQYVDIRGGAEVKSELVEMKRRLHRKPRYFEPPNYRFEGLRNCKEKDHMPFRMKPLFTRPSTDVCMRCGNSGHNMFSCSSDYFPDDLKEIQCYVCKSFGHLVCVDDYTDLGSGQVSCYRCGLSGHLGSECMMFQEDILS